MQSTDNYAKLSEKLVMVILLYVISEPTKRELWQVNEALLAAVRCVIRKWLCHQMCFHFGSSQTFLHELHRFYTGHRVKMAIDANNGGT